jgi:hypothetical protein
MIKMTFQKFRDTEWDEGDTELYIIKRGSETLYVGISECGIWNRWFGRRGGHLRSNIYGQYFPTSDIGQAILKHAPESDNWIVELWTVEECAKLFNFNHQEKPARLSLRHVEKLMIDRLRPRLNVINAPYRKALFG